MLDLKNGHQNNKRSKGDKMMRQEFNENGWKILGDWNRWAAENRWKLLGMRSLFAIGAAFDQDIADFREKYKGFTNLDDEGKAHYFEQQRQRFIDDIIVMAVWRSDGNDPQDILAKACTELLERKAEGSSDPLFLKNGAIYATIDASDVRERLDSLTQAEIGKIRKLDYYDTDTGLDI